MARGCGDRRLRHRRPAHLPFSVRARGHHAAGTRPPAGDLQAAWLRSAAAQTDRADEHRFFGAAGGRAARRSHRAERDHPQPRPLPEGLSGARADADRRSGPASPAPRARARRLSRAGSARRARPPRDRRRHRSGTARFPGHQPDARYRLPTLSLLSLMTTLITGSIAYDTIMVFPDRFRNHLLPDQLHILNVCFLTPEMRREYGGTAGNIAYNLKLLGEDPLGMATVGEDIGPYLDRLRDLDIGAEHLKRVPGQFTAQGFITTDLDNNQITAFHPGAMNYSHQNHVTGELGASLAIIGPDGKEGMLQHARECAALGLPFIFDPGQGLPMFSGAELDEFLRAAAYVAVNDYEGRMLEEKTGRKLEEIARGLKALITTFGAKGSVIFA